MSERLRLPAPAKLNLMLHITGRRDDGYHLLETVFQFIDLCDQLEFRVTDQTDILRLSSHTPVAAADDIVLATASLLQSRYAVKQGINIAIDKSIPIGGGLGGGSSNAATCLLALNQLWNLRLSLEQLAEIALELGADVPVFVRGRAAWARSCCSCPTLFCASPPGALWASSSCSSSRRSRADCVRWPGAPCSRCTWGSSC